MKSVKYFARYLIAIASITLIVSNSFSADMKLQGEDRENCVFVPGSSFTNRAERHMLYKIEMANLRATVLWTGSPEESISNVRASGDGQYVAFIWDERWDAWLKWTLVIVAQDGRLVNTVESVHDYFDWSPEVNEIVYCVVDAKDPDISKIIGIQVYDVKSSKTREIALSNWQPTIEGERRLKITWAKFDGSIYIDEGIDGRVFRYGTDSSQWTATPYHSTKFSADGKYYYGLQSESLEPPRLYLRETNKDITGEKRFLQVPELSWCRGWLSNRHLVFDGHPEVIGGPCEDIVYDCEADIAWRAPGRVLALVGNLSASIVSDQNGNLRKIPLKDLSIVTPQEITGKYEQKLKEQEERRKQKKQEQQSGKVKEK